MINPQCLELPLSRTNLHGHKDVRAIEIRLYLNHAHEKMTLCYMRINEGSNQGIYSSSIYFTGYIDLGIKSQNGGLCPLTL